VVPETLLRPAYTSVDILDVAGAIRHLDAGDSESFDETVWGEILGWSPDSEIELTSDSVVSVMMRAIELFESASWVGAQSLSSDNASGAAERLRASDPATQDGKPRGVVFGCGHYVKTAVLPNLRPFLEIDEIHEIDPVQIGPVNSGSVIFDTSPELSETDDHDVVVAAGYHHTHMPLALAALERGKYAVVEKSLVVDDSQLEALEQALRRSGRKLFAGFQRRYTPLNDWARADLCVTKGDPLSYHALVYHVPLPSRHWYRWPIAKSRLVSNGRHWVDHFLYLNGYAQPYDWDVTVGVDGQINCSVSLENGAFFTLVMPNQGSPRLGVRELVELRTADGMARIYDGPRYVAEMGDRVRHRRICKLGPYKTMYGEFGRRITEGRPADSIESVTVSARLMLNLGARLSAAVGRAPEHT
jgi:predicted dehydrogenase